MTDTDSNSAACSSGNQALEEADEQSCGICRRASEEHQLLLCDGCDLAFHTFCLEVRTGCNCFFILRMRRSRIATRLLLLLQQLPPPLLLLLPLPAFSSCACAAVAVLAAANDRGSLDARPPPAPDPPGGDRRAHV